MSLLRRSDVAATFPQLGEIGKRLGKKTRGCRCSASSARAARDAVAGFKAAVFGMDETQKSRFKSMLKADTIRVFAKGKAHVF